MVANELLSQYKNLPESFNYTGVEDFADRLSFLFTVLILLVCCSVVTVRTYVFHPLACFIPNAFGAGTAGQELFVNNYCWTEGTYAVHPQNFVIDAEKLDGGLDRYKDSRITYYQWVPLVLCIQCILFYLPRVLWIHLTNYHSGTDVSHIIRTVSDACKADQEKHDKLLKHACGRLEQLLDRSHQVSWCSRLRFLQRSAFNRLGLALSTQTQGNSIVLCYLGIKLLYFANATCQLVLMQRFLNFNSTEYGMFGLRLLGDLSSGAHWQNTMVFPRVGSCAVFVKTANGHGNWQLSQCALPINMINEKLYVFLWFWIVFVASSTAVSLVAWTLRVYSGGRSDFVKRYVRLADNYHQLRGDPWLTKFELEFLRNDGAFLLKMIAVNCGDLACAEVLRRLWHRFLIANGLSRADHLAGAGSVIVKNLVVIPTMGQPEQARRDPDKPGAFGDDVVSLKKAPAASEKRRLSVQRSISTA